MTAVSFVVPVRNGASTIRQALQAIVAQADGRPMEIIVVDDGSDDGSASLLEHLATIWPLRLVRGGGRGAAAALNLGIRVAQFPVICQVDQDVIVEAGWMRRLTDAMDDPHVAAVQGYYATHPDATFFARIMGFDLEQRYGNMGEPSTTHVCTGNVAYRAAALHAAGLFDESLGYGYDNDISYRLQRAGYRLTLCREARSHHHWREGLAGYCIQQYGFGYGRLDVVARHPQRIGGDSVSPAWMMAHPAMMLAALACLAAALVSRVAGVDLYRAPALVGVALLVLLTSERFLAGIHAAVRFRSVTPLCFPGVHLLRDMVWAFAVLVWCGRRVRNRPSRPEHSMRPRTAAAVRVHPACLPEAASARTLCLIPVHNEAANLPAVLFELRAERPDLDILLLDDGSTDGTRLLAGELDVRFLQMPERMGIGSAMRAGFRYAARTGYRTAVRLDGDGQHRPADIAQLLLPILEGRADVVVGSRYCVPGARRLPAIRFFQRLLAACLSMLIRKAITDPTSGFCAFGGRAINLLAEEHPTGYPEPELLLLLKGRGLRAIEAPVLERKRLGGRTSLTLSRTASAFGRVVLAMVIFPLRPAVNEIARD